MVAVYKNGKYYRAELLDGRLVIEFDKSEFAELSQLETIVDVLLSEELLDSLDIPNLGYKKTDTGFQIFDVTKEEYMEESLPMYVDVFGEIKKSQKRVSFKIPTKEAIDASEEMCRKVNIAIRKIRDNKIAENAIKLVNKTGLAYINLGMLRDMDIFYSALLKKQIKILFEFNHHYIIGSSVKEPHIDLYVPQNIIPIVLGKGGERIKQIAKKVKAKKIVVKPLEL